MLVYPNNLNYQHNNRAYFRIILGKNGITSMALCGYPLTSAPILSYSRKIGDEKIVEEQLIQIRQNFQYLNCLVAFRR